MVFQILEGKLIPGLSMYELNDRSVVFYFNEVSYLLPRNSAVPFLLTSEFFKICSSEEICFKYKTTEKFEVKHQVPVSAEVYDYYKRGNI